MVKEIKGNKCISCGKELDKGIIFPCPKCGKQIARCEKCRRSSIKYKCECGFGGP